MFILYKKRIVLALIGFTIFLSIYGIIYENRKDDIDEYLVKEQSYNQARYVNTIPVTNKVIILDAGHGFPDGGAVGITGAIESNINLAITLKLQELLEESGSTVVLTRSDENGIYDVNEQSKKVSDIKNRVKIGNNCSADIFVSIHLNKINDQRQKGWQTFYNKKSKDGKKLSEDIQYGLNEVIDKNNKRKPKTINNIYIIDHVEIPTCIVECGFLSNIKEEKKLEDAEYQDMLAYGIYLGIINYFYK